MQKTICIVFLTASSMWACSPDANRASTSGAEYRVPTPASPAVADKQATQPMPQSDPSTPPHTNDGKTIVKKIVVQREGSNRGIEAEVNRIDSEGKSFYFSSTNNSGVATPNLPCVSTDRFDAKPKISGYLRVAYKACGETISIDLPSAQATYAMVALGAEALKSNDFAKAQAYYAAAASRLNIENRVEAGYLNDQAMIAAGKALGISEPTMSVNGVEIFTTSAARKLMEFQASKDIKATGILDADTQERLSGLKESTVIVEALSVSPARVEKLKWTSPISGRNLDQYDAITRKMASPSEFTFDPNMVGVKIFENPRAAAKKSEMKEKSIDFKAKTAGAKDLGRN